MKTYIKRLVAWFSCNHRNQITTIKLADGCNVMICGRCARSWFYEDGADPDRQREEAINRAGG